MDFAQARKEKQVRCSSVEDPNEEPVEEAVEEPVQEPVEDPVQESVAEAPVTVYEIWRFVAMREPILEVLGESVCIGWNYHRQPLPHILGYHRFV